MGATSSQPVISFRESAVYRCYVPANGDGHPEKFVGRMIVDVKNFGPAWVATFNKSNGSETWFANGKKITSEDFVSKWKKDMGVDFKWVETNSNGYTVEVTTLNINKFHCTPMNLYDDGKWKGKLLGMGAFGSVWEYVQNDSIGALALQKALRKDGRVQKNVPIVLKASECTTRVDSEDQSSHPKKCIPYGADSPQGKQKYKRNWDLAKNWKNQNSIDTAYAEELAFMNAIQDHCDSNPKGQLLAKDATNENPVNCPTATPYSKSVVVQNGRAKDVRMYAIPMELLTEGSMQTWVRSDQFKNKPQLIAKFTLELLSQVRQLKLVKPPKIQGNQIEARQNGILHSDIKPVNVMIKNGLPVLVDYGVAQQFYCGDKLCEWQAGGTFSWMSYQHAMRMHVEDWIRQTETREEDQKALIEEAKSKEYGFLSVKASPILDVHAVAQLVLYMVVSPETWNEQKTVEVFLTRECFSLHGSSLKTKTLDMLKASLAARKLEGKVKARELSLLQKQLSQGLAKGLATKIDLAPEQKDLDLGKKILKWQKLELEEKKKTYAKAGADCLSKFFPSLNKVQTMFGADVRNQVQTILMNFRDTDEKRNEVFKAAAKLEKLLRERNTIV